VKQTSEKESPPSSRLKGDSVKPQCGQAVKALPRRLFRHRPPRPTEPRARDIWDVDPGDDRRFLAFMRTLDTAAQREIDRLSEEAAMLMLLFFFARYRGWRRVRVNGKIIDLTGDLPGWGRIIPSNLPDALRKAWEAIAP
jgi:hypothetical protein